MTDVWNTWLEATVPGVSEYLAYARKENYQEESSHAIYELQDKVNYVRQVLGNEAADRVKQLQDVQKKYIAIQGLIIALEDVTSAFEDVGDAPVVDQVVQHYRNGHADY
jgi:hypothetical protein